MIFIASESGLSIPADMIHYGFSKTRQSLCPPRARQAAGRHRRHGQSVLPGPTLSEGMQSMLADSPAASDQPIEAVAAAFLIEERRNSIIQRAATVDEVANMEAKPPRPSPRQPRTRRADGGVVDTIA